jgi:hypothetical protein
MEEIFTQIMERLKEMATTGIKKQGVIRKFWVAIDSLLIIDAAKTLPFFRLLSLQDQVKRI